MLLLGFIFYKIDAKHNYLIMSLVIIKFDRIIKILVNKNNIYFFENVDFLHFSAIFFQNRNRIV